MRRVEENTNISIGEQSFQFCAQTDEKKEKKKKTGGLFHVAGLSCESRYDFSNKLAKKFGYDESLISKVISSEFKQKAKRPAYSCLNCQKAINEFGLKLLTTDEAIEIMKKQVEKEAPHFLAENK